MAEVPWYSEPPIAALKWFDNRLGILVFHSPENGEIEHVYVTRGEMFELKWDHVWHIVVDGTRAIVSPSIHFIGHFHSPSPVEFRLVN